MATDDSHAMDLRGAYDFVGISSPEVRDEDNGDVCAVHTCTDILDTNASDTLDVFRSVGRPAKEVRKRIDDHPSIQHHQSGDDRHSIHRNAHPDSADVYVVELRFRSMANTHRYSTTAPPREGFQ